MLECAYMFLSWLPTTEDSPVRSECVHVVKLRDISKGKRIMRRDFMVLLFLFWVSWFDTNMVHPLQNCKVRTCMHASTIETLLPYIIACCSICINGKCLHTVLSSIYLRLAQPSTLTTYAACRSLLISSSPSIVFQHDKTQTESSSYIN